MEPLENVKKKIEQGAYANLPQKFPNPNPKKKIEKVEKPIVTATVQSEGAAHIADDTEIDKAKAPERKVTALPVKGTINKFGFIGVSIGLCNALSLPLNLEPRVKGKMHPKLAHDIVITFSTYDSATKILTIIVG